MDGSNSGSKRRLLLGLISNLISKAATSVIQLLQVPMFLHFWSVPLYGEWMIVTSIPSYLSFSNMGFGSVAANEMTMSMAAGERERALSVFQSCWWLIVILCSTVGLIFGLLLFVFPVSTLLNIHTISSIDTKWIIFYLMASVLLGQLEQLLQSAYTCVGRYAYGSFLKSCMSLFAFALMAIPVLLRQGARETALVFALANIAATIFLCLMVRKDIPWIAFGWKHASFIEIKRLTAPAIAFMGFPIGNAINLQGTLMAIGYVLGPSSVVVFGTARTVSRIALQVIQMVNSAFWPELSAAYGAKNTDLVRSLHRRACQLALVFSAIAVLATLGLGPIFLSHWTGGHVPPSRELLFILMLGVCVYSFWSTSSALVAAINQHRTLARVYMIGTGITIVLTYILAKNYGIYGAAFSLLLSEIIMTIYVLPNSLRIAEDHFPDFIKSLTVIPRSISPRELWRHIKMPKPT